MVGDLLLGIARNRGVVGFVTDGLVRDLVDLEALELPVFAIGRDAEFARAKRARNGRPADHLRRAAQSPRATSSSAIATASSVVPRARIAETLANLERVKAAEAAMLERVRGGLKEVPS